MGVNMSMLLDAKQRCQVVIFSMLRNIVYIFYMHSSHTFWRIYLHLSLLIMYQWFSNLTEISLFKHQLKTV